MSKRNSVKKVQVRAPGNRSALARVFAETIRDGVDLHNSDGADDEDEVDEEELDDEQLQYTAQESDARAEREKAKTRAKLVHAVISDISEKNRGILVLGQAMVPTPTADRYADETMLDAKQHDDAMKRLPTERLAVEKALAEARRKAEEEEQGKGLAQAVQARITAMKKNKDLIVQVWEGTAPPTPCADQYDGKRTLSQKEHADAMARLSGEESAVQKALDQAIEAADAQGEQEVRARDEGMARAKLAHRKIFELSELYSRFSSLTDKMGIEPAEGPDHDEFGKQSLTEGQFDDLQKVLKQEKDSLTAWLPLLLPARDWSPAELINREGEVDTAYAGVQDALQSDSLLTLLPPGGVKEWMGKLAGHRQAQRTALDLATLRDAVGAFYDALNKDRNVPEKVNKQLMERFAAEYGYKPDQWNTYKAIYQEYFKADKGGAQALRDGRLTRDKLRGVLPSGTTAGQWYTEDKSCVDDGKTYYYHLSVAFSITAGKKSMPDMATITGAHVSFKRYNTKGDVIEDRKCWYSINKGTFAFTSGSPNNAGPTADMRGRADALLAKTASRLNCTF